MNTNWKQERKHYEDNNRDMGHQNSIQTLCTEKSDRRNRKIENTFGSNPRNRYVGLSID